MNTGAISTRPLRHFTQALTIFLATAVMLVALPVLARTQCHSSAEALAQAYVRANPVYAMYFGDLESLIAEDPAQFAEGSLAVRCARLMTEGLMKGAIISYDLDAQSEQPEMGTSFDPSEISPAPMAPTISDILLQMAQQMAWLSRVLPAVAAGDYVTLNTRATPTQTFAHNMLPMLLHDPKLKTTFAQQEPIIRQSARFEYLQVKKLARSLDE